TTIGEGFLRLEISGKLNSGSSDARLIVRASEDSPTRADDISRDSRRIIDSGTPFKFYVTIGWEAQCTGEKCTTSPDLEIAVISPLGKCFVQPLAITREEWASGEVISRNYGTIAFDKECIVPADW
ncbi:MAG: hypothetical protein R3F18_20980, partial [Lysobacterales bacterium]